MFYDFCKVNAIASFTLSIAWPIFPITLGSILKLQPSMLTILSISQGLASLSIQRYMDRVIYRYGYGWLSHFTESILVMVPISYMLVEITDQPLILVANNIVLCLISALGEMAYTTYLLGIVSELEREERIAIYNVAVDITTTISSFIGGYMAGVMERYLGLI